MVVVAKVMVQGVLVEVDCVGVVSGSISGSFVVVLVLEDFGLVLCSSWRMALCCCNKRGNFLGRFNLILVAGNILVAGGARLFGIVIWWGFLDFLGFFYFLELMEEVGVLLW